MQGTGPKGSIPGSGRSPRGGHGNPLQYSCLDYPMDRGAWWAIVHRLQRVRGTEHTCSCKYAWKMYIDLYLGGKRTLLGKVSLVSVVYIH